MALNEILLGLADFGDDELKKIRAHVDFILKQRGVKNTISISSLPDGDLFYAELKEAMKRMGTKPDSKQGIEAKQNYAENFRDALAVLNDFSNNLPKNKRVYKAALYRWAIGLAIAFCARKGIPLTMFYFVFVLKDFDSIVEQSFPGYASNGLLTLLLEKVLHG